MKVLELTLFLVVVIAIIALIVRAIRRSFLDRCPACEKGLLHYRGDVMTAQGKATRFSCDRCSHAEYITAATSRAIGGI